MKYEINRTGITWEDGKTGPFKGSYWLDSLSDRTWSWHSLMGTVYKGRVAVLYSPKAWYKATTGR